MKKNVNYIGLSVLFSIFIFASELFEIIFSLTNFKMKRIIVILLLLFYGYTNAQNETLNYKIMKSTINIGNLTVIKTQDKNNMKINIESDVKVKILININVKYQLNCTYKNNELVTSSVIVYKNGNIHSTSKIIKNSNYYVVHNNDIISKFYNKIDYSGALLFFNEPKNILTVFSESDFIEKPVRNIGINRYQTTNPKNCRQNEYYYKKGILQSAIIDDDFMTFKLILKNN